MCLDAVKGPRTQEWMQVPGEGGPGATRLSWLGHLCSCWGSTWAECLEAKEKQAQICIMESLSSGPSRGVRNGLQQ